MPQVKALVLFEHHGRRNVGDVFELGDKHANALVSKGLVELLESDTAHAEKPAAKTSPRAKPEKKSD